MKKMMKRVIALSLTTVNLTSSKKHSLIITAKERMRADL